MIGPYFSFNGELRPIEQSLISIDDLSFLYGYGVYENLKVRNRVLFFPEMHIARLRHSAKVIELPTQLKPHRIKNILDSFVQAMTAESYNIKMLLMGNELGSSDLYISASNPKYITEKDYRDGVSVITYHGERLFPQAKTLNMLMSFLAHKRARDAGAFDALLVDNEGNVREGTKTNLFFTDGKTIFTPPSSTVLEGVTKITLTEALLKKKINVREKDLPLKDIGLYGLFLTSTSAKVLPVSMFNGKKIIIHPLVREVMNIYDEYLDAYILRHDVMQTKIHRDKPRRKRRDDLGLGPLQKEVQHDTKHGALGI